LQIFTSSKQSKHAGYKILIGPEINSVTQ